MPTKSANFAWEDGNLVTVTLPKGAWVWIGWVLTWFGLFQASIRPFVAGDRFPLSRQPRTLPDEKQAEALIAAIDHAVDVHTQRRKKNRRREASLYGKHQRLVAKKFDAGISQQEEAELAQVREAIDHLEMVALGPDLDRLERVALAKEHLAGEVMDLLGSIRTWKAG